MQKYEYTVKSVNSFSDGWLAEYLNDMAANRWQLRHILESVDQTLGRKQTTLIFTRRIANI